MKGMPYFNSLIRSYALFYTPHLSDGRLARSGEQLTARLLWVIAVSVGSSAGRSHSVTQSSCHTVILSHSWQSSCHTVILSKSSYHAVILSHSHLVTQSFCHTVILSHSWQSSCHSHLIMLLSCHTVILSHSHLIKVILLCSYLVTQSSFHTVILAHRHLVK